MTQIANKNDLDEKLTIAEAMKLPDTKKRQLAVTLLASASPHDPQFLAYMANASAEEKEAALEAAINEGLKELNAGKGIKGTPAEHMARMKARMDKKLGVCGNGTP
jgi:predicted transcriptional regulator